MAVKHFMLLGATAVIGLSSCASLSLADPKPAADQRASKTAALAPQVLSVNECAAFVWTADEEKRFILFSKTQEEYALWQGPDGPQTLTLTAGSGEKTQQQFPQNDFGIITLDLREPQAITNGTRYRSGTLTDKQDGDWARVTSVVGVTVCQPPS